MRKSPLIIAVLLPMLAGTVGAAEENGESLGDRLRELEKRVGRLEQRLEEPATEAAQAESPAQGEAAAEVAPEAHGVEARLLDTGFREADLQAGTVNDRLILDLELRNRLDRGLRAYSGVLQVSDVFDQPLLRVRLTATEPLDAGATVAWKGWVPYQDFDAGHGRLRAAEPEDLRADLVLERAVYSDGERATFGSERDQKVAQLRRLEEKAPEAAEEEAEPETAADEAAAQPASGAAEEEGGTASAAAEPN